MTETAETATAGSAGGNAGRPNALPIAVLLLGAALAYGFIAFQVLVSGHSSTEEIAYLIKSWWYTSGIVPPYTANDATGKMPFYFYQLGFWQQLEGMGHFSARLTSVGIGIINGALLFAICRRITANPLVAAAASFIFLATPATTFYFATATPTATVSALHLLAIWLIVSNLGRQRPWATILMGLLCTAMYFYRQNMLLSIVVLVPLYIAAIGRQRALHGAMLLASIAVTAAAVLFSFPEKLGEYALRLPVISPWLNSLGLLAPNFALIDNGTVGGPFMGPAFVRLAPSDMLNGFLLPYSGTILLALLLLALTGKGLRVLWIAPFYFLWLAVTHYLTSLGYCSGCIVSYAPYFSAVGALAAGLALAMLGFKARQHRMPSAPLILIAAVVAVALNTFAPSLATQEEYRGFPIPLLTQPHAKTELSEIEPMARWISANVPAREPILVLHSLGKHKLPSLPYAVFLSGHAMPTQSIDLDGTRRVLNSKLSGRARESVQAAIEEESLWSDETLARWLGRDYDVVLFQSDTTVDQRSQLAAITARFDQAASVEYQGATLYLFKRKPAQ